MTLQFLFFSSFLFILRKDLSLMVPSCYSWLTCFIFEKVYRKNYKWYKQLGKWDENELKTFDWTNTSIHAFHLLAVILILGSTKLRFCNRWYRPSSPLDVLCLSWIEVAANSTTWLSGWSSAVKMKKIICRLTSRYCRWALETEWGWRAKHCQWLSDG